jgi:hypothetical protein
MGTVVFLNEGSKVVAWRVYPHSTKREKLGTYNSYDQAVRIWGGR